MEWLEPENLPQETLVKLLRVFSLNWRTADGLWFQNVEDEFGLDVATKLDAKMWQKQSIAEAKRIKEALNITEGGLPSVIRVLNFMTWQVASPFFELEEETSDRVVLSYPRCPMQEARLRQGRREFPCKEIGLIYFSNIARVVEPKMVVRCLLCPPDPHPPDLWCKWELALDRG